jgi:hypothetical protein
MELSPTVPVGALGAPRSLTVAVQLVAAGSVTVTGEHATLVVVAYGSESTASPQGLGPLMKFGSCEIHRGSRGRSCSRTRLPSRCVGRRPPARSARGCW